MLKVRGVDDAVPATAVTPAGTGVDTSVSSPARARSAVVDVSDLYERISPSIVEIHGNSNRSSGTGSGVVLDSTGNILTNYHVVQGFNQIDVRFLDGISVSARIVGSNAGDDL